MLSNYLKSSILFVSLLVACKSHKVANLGQQELTQLLKKSSDDSWGGDVVFTITDIDRNTAENKYVLKALYNKDSVGISVIIPNKKVSTDGFGDGLKIVSLGKISDNFLAALTAIYKLKPAASTFTKQADASFVDLEQFAINLAGEKPTNLEAFKTYKLFLIDKAGEEAEVYLNISERELKAELNEKDLEYREPLINSFSK